MSLGFFLNTAYQYRYIRWNIQALFSWSMTALLRNIGHIFVVRKSEDISMKSIQQSISFVITTKMGPFVSIIQHIIFEKFIWCPSKYHEMKMLLPVTSAKKWPESVMLTVNIATRGVCLWQHNKHITLNKKLCSITFSSISLLPGRLSVVYLYPIQECLWLRLASLL